MKTPYFLIHKEKFIDNCDSFFVHFQDHWNGQVRCAYSVKTNNNVIMLRLAHEQGMYAEVVSEQEYLLAKKCGFKDSDIIYNGPAKGNTFLSACIRGAKTNIDNLNELEILAGKLQEQQKKEISVGLRINFDLEAEVPGETSTGQDVGRFGICYENGDLERALLRLDELNISLAGIHIHYTTKTRSLKVFSAIAAKIDEICKRYSLNPQYVDIGGGFWGGRILEGKPTVEQYATEVVKGLGGLNNEKVELIMEPGSAICASAVDYVTKVISVKDIRKTRIVLVDGSSLHINPFMLKRIPTHRLPELGNMMIPCQQVCGATCLESDRFLVLKDAGELKVGSEIVFTNAGAYTMSFVSDFILKKPCVYLDE